MAIDSSNIPEPESRSASGIRKLFDGIAQDYDRLNHLLSLGIDRSWRRRALRWIVEPSVKQDILDIACGTGDFSIAIARKAAADSVVTGVDLSDGMLAVMDEKVRKEALEGNVRCAGVKAADLSRKVSGKPVAEIRFEQGDSECMRFDDCSFDRATIAFGIRNFEHREAALKEILRVLKPGGRLVILELSVPSFPPARWIYNLYFTKVLPLIGGWISGDKSAYRYLPASVLKFPPKDEWMKTMSSCGFASVRHESFTFGICRMYVADKQQ